MNNKKYCIKFLGIELKYQKDLFYQFDITDDNFINVLNNAIKIITVKDDKTLHSNFVLSIERDNGCFYMSNALSVNLGYKSFWTFRVVKNGNYCTAKLFMGAKIGSAQSRYGKMNDRNNDYLYFHTLQIPDILEVISCDKNELAKRLGEIKKPKLAKPSWVLM
jgi:hypothetical protein